MATSFTYRLFSSGELLVEQHSVRAPSLWELLRILAMDCREELEECDRLEIEPTGFSLLPQDHP